VIAMLSIGAGAQQKMIAFIEQLAAQHHRGSPRGPVPELQRVRKLSAGLSFQDLRAIQANMAGLAASSARKRLVPTQVRPKRRATPTVRVSSAYQKIAGLVTTRGLHRTGRPGTQRSLSSGRARRRSSASTIPSGSS
jgi:hypothetical protein